MIPITNHPSETICPSKPNYRHTVSQITFHPSYNSTRQEGSLSVGLFECSNKCFEEVRAQGLNRLARKWITVENKSAWLWQRRVTAFRSGSSRAGWLQGRDRVTAANKNIHFTVFFLSPRVNFLPKQCRGIKQTNQKSLMGAPAKSLFAIWVQFPLILTLFLYIDRWTWQSRMTLWWSM